MQELPPIIAAKRRWLLGRLIINGILQSLMIVGSMLLVRHAFNVLLNPAFDDPEVHLYEMTDISQIALFAAGLLGCTGVAAWLRWIERIDAERLGQQYVHRVRMRLFDRMKNFAPRALSQRSTGASALRFIGDLSAIRRWVSLGLARIVVAGIVSLFSLGFLASLDYYLAAGCLIILSLGLGWNLLLGPRMHHAVAEARQLRGRLAGNINEKIRSFVVIQAFNQTRREQRRFRRQSLQLQDAMITRAQASARMRVVTDGATAISMGLILSLGSLEVFYGLTSSGNVVAAMAVVGFLSTGFRDMGRVHEYRQDFRVSRQKLVEFMKTQPLKGRSTGLPDLKVTQGVVEFQNVRLDKALRGISATVPAGARLALSGPNGAGKSTLLQVAARQIDPDRGRVLIDGQSIRRCNLASVRKAIGIVSPDLPLLRGSLKYNLSYRHPDATSEEIDRVSRLSLLDEMIARLPGGLRYRILEGGQNLSLGQRHRLALARALLGNPALLIVDEIDANLDPPAGQAFEQILEQYPGTILMVTRSTEHLAHADQIWHMDQGRLIKIEQVSDSATEPARSLQTHKG